MVQTAILRTYRRRLTNLSSRNRSLLLSNLPSEQFIDVHELDFLLNKTSFEVIAQLLTGKRSVTLCDVMDARNERVNVVSRKLRRIARTERFIEEERGSEDLYVGWPFVRGKFMDGTVVHGPLLFFPVHLEQHGNQWRLERRGDVLAMINQTMLLAYAYFNQVKIAEDDTEKTFDDFEKEPLAFRTQLYEWLKTTPLTINFNQDLFTDKLLPFDKQNSKSLDTLELTGELKLYPEAVLGIFPQAGSFLVPDYDALIDREAGESGSESKEDVLSGNTSHSTFLPEQKIYTPLPMDASQEAAVRAVKAGESLVVQGPPGTGKSQLIANLMADTAAQGLRVLLVCQKRAALDVVYDRLEQVGMAPFTALIHDFQDDRKGLYAQIAAQIDLVDAYRQQNYSLNAVLMEREFDAESRRIDELTSELQAFKDALFDDSLCGLSAKELYLSSYINAPVIDLADVYEQFYFDEQLNDFLHRLANYEAYQHRLGPKHPWNERVSFAGFGMGQLAAIERVILDVPETVQQVNQQVESLLSTPMSRTLVANWQEHAWSLTALLNLVEGQRAQPVWTIAQALRTNPTQSASQISDHDLLELSRQWENALVLPGPETSLATSELMAFSAVLREAIGVRSSWVNWQLWQLNKAAKVRLQQVTQANGLTLSLEDLQKLAQKLAKRRVIQQLQPRINGLLAGISQANSPHQVIEALKRLRQARELTARFEEIQVLHDLQPGCWLTATSFAETVRKLLVVTEGVSKKNTEWVTYLTDQQIEHLWEEGATYADTLRKALRSDFELLVEADRIFAGLSETERVVLARLDLAEMKTGEVLQNSLRLTWLDHLERVYPQLRSVSSLRMEQMEEALQASVQKKQALSRDILLVKLREQPYRNLTLNRLNNVVTYRELQHQATKKRNVWPVRKLMEQYADEVFRLIPCWMASPESVSAIFPLREGLFDLVIFDEASQCFAENGIPAMYRGKQVVVTGDSQQLRPSDVYRIRMEDEATEEDIPAALEVESLLELAAQWLQQVSLTGHYRSRSLDLIQFSNQHFYQQKLTLLPDFREVNQQQPAIRYLNVKGTWQQNTNPAEAEAVVQLVGQLVEEMPGRSMGIVTFNFPQQQLIQELLDPLNASDRPFPEIEGLFVKNIENVQGDERDIIIFSVGYAPDERGRMAMQFGSLNTRGGENRLNVAVTRARERVYVVTSLWPDQLKVQETANQGPKLLKAYLQYALDVAQEQFRPEPRQVEGLRAGALLKDQLAAIEPTYQVELPFADLTIKIDNQYQGLILTDDDQYYKQTPKDAHAYTPLALKHRHWPYQRIWSRLFWRSSKQE